MSRAKQNAVVQNNLDTVILFADAANFGASCRRLR